MPFRLPWPLRRAEQPSCNAPLTEGEAVLRGQRCTLVYGRERKRGALHLTTRRLIFEADRGDARWLIIALDEIARVGAYRSPGTAGHQLWVETKQGEHAPFVMSRDEAQAWVEAIEKTRRPVSGERLLE